jgi:hypothetical protein
MSAVTIIVPAGFGWGIAWSSGWKEKRTNLEAERIIGRYGICR